MQQVLFRINPPTQKRLQGIESALIKASLYQKEIILIQNILHLNGVITYSGHLLIKRKSDCFIRSPTHPREVSTDH